MSELKNPGNFHTLGQRQKPRDLNKILSLLKLVEQNFPNVVEVPNPDNHTHDSLRHNINKPVSSWLKHRWAADLNITWWDKHWPAIIITEHDNRLWITSRGAKIDETALSNSIAVSHHTSINDSVHHVFDSAPEPDIINAFLTLFQGEFISGQIRFNFEPEVKDYPEFDNVQFFQPDGESYWVMF